MAVLDVMATASLFKRQHIQDHAAAKELEYHWGYASRVVPCVNDIGTCEYLDAVYWMHDTSMLYTFIMWAVIGGLLAFAVAFRLFKPPAQRNLQRAGLESQNSKGTSAYYRACRSVQSFVRRRLLPESFVGFFGHVTRLQLLVLAILLAYLLIFSLIGIVYKTWITPVKKTNLFNTRTGIGGFADRVGALAYALTPLTVALATRESILTLLTGIPYQSFNFLHRWLGRIIFIQSVLHTIGWTIIEARLYQPQPTVWKNFIKQLYMIWGCIALIFIFFLYVFSLQRVIRWTGYEFFRKTHYIVAMLYLGACWGHWNQLACWMIASLGVWFLDRGVRLLRTLLIHVGKLDKSKGFGFHPAQSSLEYFDDQDGGVVRLEFSHNHDTWSIGQHFFLCFPALSIWQSHPFTTLSVPNAHPALPHHVYIARCRTGETARLKTLALGSLPDENKPSTAITTPVILSGPYGSNLLPRDIETTNILAIAGGTGVSLTLPLALSTAASPAFSGAAIDFVWIIRRASNQQWVTSELSRLKQLAQRPSSNLRIHIYVTQEGSASDPQDHNTIIGDDQQDSDKALEIKVSPISGDTAATAASESSSSSSSSTKSEKQRIDTTMTAAHNTNFTISYLNSAQPSLADITSNFISSRAIDAFRTRVVASGPRSMGGDLRSAVAAVNDGGKVWKGERRWDVSLEWDDRG